MKRLLMALLVLLFSVGASAASYSLNANFGVETAYTPGSGAHTPFLLTANEWDSRNFNTGSGYLNFHIHPTITLPFGLNLSGGLTYSSRSDLKGWELKPVESYLKTKILFLNVFAGRMKSSYGSQDAFSSGNILWSQNARPMRRIGIESNGWLNVPFTQRFIQVKGGISHGVFDNVGPIHDILLHHKQAYIRLGGMLPVHVSYGLQHGAQWGGTSNGTYPFGAVNWDNYKRILFGKSGGAGATVSDQINAFGNHLISQDLSLEFTLKTVTGKLYWQNLQEDGPIKNIFATPNNKDGLWGLSLNMPKNTVLSHVVLEYLSTTDQSGPYHDLDGIIYGGNDSYLTGQYPIGWSNDGMTLGNPWLTSPRYNKNGSTTIQNNCVRLWYFSGAGAVSKHLTYRLTTAFSKNWGTEQLIFPPYKDQFSVQLKTGYQLKLGKLEFGVSLDRGAMYGNNTAAIIGYNLGF